MLGAAYMLWLYRRVVFGELVKAELKSISDCNRREMLFFVPLAAAVLIMGIWPESLLDAMHVSVANLVEQTAGANDTVSFAMGDGG